MKKKQQARKTKKSSKSRLTEGQMRFQKKKNVKRVIAKAAKTKKVIKKSAKLTKVAARKGVERREFRRINARNLWVTELSGDYQFVAQARDISQGGIFLNGRMKTSQTPSIIRIQFNGQPIELMAQPVYDQVSNKDYGTGYQFMNMSVALAKTLKSFLSSLR